MNLYPTIRTVMRVRLTDMQIFFLLFYETVLCCVVLLRYVNIAWRKINCCLIFRFIQCCGSATPFVDSGPESDPAFLVDPDLDRPFYISK
jgi:hypothetical protein